MQADVISYNTRGVEDAFKILYDDKNHRYTNRVQPIAPLKSSNENGWHPAYNYPDVRDHGEDDNEHANQWRKIESHDRQRGPDEDSVHQANKKLPPKIRCDVLIDLRQCFRDFIPGRRCAQWQVFLPFLFDARFFVEQEK